jgi:hypothetical protein
MHEMNLRHDEKTGAYDDAEELNSFHFAPDEYQG